MTEKRRYIFPTLILILFASALLFFAMRWAGHDVWPIGVQLATSASVSAPSLAEIEAAGGPVRIIIPAIGVDADIEHVGRTAKNEIGIPKDFGNTAWFTESSLPGAPGNSVIDGHVNDRLSLPAVFADLDKLVAGDRVMVRYANGLTLAFVVTENQIYDLATAPMDRIIGSTSASQLNLITCTGTWVQTARMYDKRRVVFTELVERI